MQPVKPIPILVSACLCGRACRYDGRDAAEPAKLEARLQELGGRAVPFCPEEEGGLSTPRPPAWIETTGAEAVLAGSDKLVTEAGDDVTHAFVSGARAALAACEDAGIKRAILKERSPSCGVKRTHIRGALNPGPGVTAALLAQNGIETEGI